MDCNKLLSKATNTIVLLVKHVNKLALVLQKARQQHLHILVITLKIVIA